MTPLLRAPSLSDLPGVCHGFSTREGGVSAPPYHSLNLALADDDPDAIVENWRRALNSLHPGCSPDQLALIEQVHGRGVWRATQASGPLSVLARADALITTTPGVVLAVRTADCVPILLAHPVGVAAVHAGWRGVAADIVAEAVRALRSLVGSGGAIVAAVGPHIGVDAYEVGPEVVAGIAASGVPHSVFVRQHTSSPRESAVGLYETELSLRPAPSCCRSDRSGLPRPQRREQAPAPTGAFLPIAASAPPHVDLGAAVDYQLRRCGVQHVDHLARCTYTDPQLFSYRRDGHRSGRLAAMILLEPT